MSSADFSVFLIDDDAGVLKALARLLRTAGYKTRTFSSPEQFLCEHDPEIPGCAVLDFAMPGLDGLALQQALMDRDATRPIIFLSGNSNIPVSVRAMQAGAVDFLVKPVNKTQLLQAVARAVDRDERTRRDGEDYRTIQRQIARLTRREHQVLVQVIAGRLNKQIAAELGTVEKTIKVHRSRMMAKMGVRTVAELVRLTEKVGMQPWASAPH